MGFPWWVPDIMLKYYVKRIMSDDIIPVEH